MATAEATEPQVDGGHPDPEVETAFDGMAEQEREAAEADAPEEPTAYTKAEQAHYQEIKRKEQDVGRLASLMDIAKEDAKAAKGRYEAAATELHAIIRRGPDDQPKLTGMEDVDEPASDAWRDLPLSAAGIDGKLAKAMTDEEGFKTLGEVADWLAAGSSITDIKGIGPAAGDKYADLMQMFWAAHPEFCEAEEDGEADAEDEDADDDGTDEGE